MLNYIIASGGTISSSNDILLIVAAFIAALLLLQGVPVVFTFVSSFLRKKFPHLRIFRKASH